MPKSTAKSINRNKNKLNSKIILIFSPNPNARLGSPSSEMVKVFGLPRAIPAKTSQILKWD